MRELAYYDEHFFAHTWSNHKREIGLVVSVRSKRKELDDPAVSEVIGVVMLLAMVITMMGGVFVFLTPYVSDFQDNTAWSNADGIAERLDNRIDVVAGEINDTGLRTTISTITSSITPILNSEEWTISADLTPDDIITVIEQNQSSFEVTSVNETATSALIWTQSGHQHIDFLSASTQIIVNHELNLGNTYYVTIYDTNGKEIHRHVKASLSGLMVKTEVNTGQHEIALVNDGRYDRFSDEPWSITYPPDMNIDELFDGTMRVSLSLRTINTVGGLPDGRRASFDFTSAGPISLFTGDAWNFRFGFESTLGPTITPQLSETWLTDYTLHRAAGTLDQHRGISPWQRTSGIDGLTVDGGNSVIDLEVDLQIVEVSE